MVFYNSCDLLMLRNQFFLFLVKHPTYIVFLTLYQLFKGEQSKACKHIYIISSKSLLYEAPKCKEKIVCRTSKVMVVCWRTPRFEQFARRHSGSVKLGHRTPRTGCSRLRREKILFWTSSAPEPQMGPPLSLSLTRRPHLSSSSSSSSPLLFFHC